MALLMTTTKKDGLRWCRIRDEAGIVSGQELPVSLPRSVSTGSTAATGDPRMIGRVRLCRRSELSVTTRISSASI